VTAGPRKSRAQLMHHAGMDTRVGWRAVDRPPGLHLTLHRRRNNNSFSAAAWFPRERDRTAYVAQGRAVTVARNRVVWTKEGGGAGGY